MEWIVEIAETTTKEKNLKQAADIFSRLLLSNLSSCERPAVFLDIVNCQWHIHNKILNHK